MNTKRLLKGKGIGFVVIIVLIIIIAIIYWPKPPPPPPQEICNNLIDDDGDALIDCDDPDCALDPTCIPLICSPDGCSGICPVDCTIAEDPDCGCQDDNGCCGIGCNYTNDNDCLPLNELRVHFIDVGQGDSILVDLGSNEVLIDGGGKSPGVTDYIGKYIDGPLEVMVATHPHADHIGGLIEALEVLQVEEIWLNGDTSTSKTYQDFMAAVNTEEAEVNQAKRNGTISTEDLNFSILNPPDSLFSETNNNSIVLRLEYGDIAFLFTGDAEKEAEASMLTTGSELWAQILKAGHHCSKTASTKAFLERVKPEKAICMVGENNRYGHPHQETLTALKEIGAEIYRTDTDGTIIVLTDGISYEVETSK